MKFNKNISKLLISCVLLFCAGIGISYYTALNKLIANTPPSRLDVLENNNISDLYNVSQKRAIKKSKQSSVRVLSFDIKSSTISVSSGTYFEYQNEFYVLTVQHGILGGCDSIQIATESNLYDCLGLLAYDSKNDYVIVAVNKIADRKAIHFPNDFVKTRTEWKNSLSTLNSLLYTGYPNSFGPVTLDGKVMGMSEDEHIYFNSYAWSGSSGSGIFNYKGKFVGYIVAIDVGQTEFGYDVLENVILVIPNYKIDWSVLYKK
jgi:hypothetical protein